MPDDEPRDRFREQLDCIAVAGTRRWLPIPGTKPGLESQLCVDLRGEQDAGRSVAQLTHEAKSCFHLKRSYADDGAAVKVEDIRAIAADAEAAYVRVSSNLG